MTTRFTRKEIEERGCKERALFVIDNVVYDVTEFLDDHPGGAEILIDNAGKDASGCFHDVGHSEEARELKETYAVGKVVEEDRWPVRKPERGHWATGQQELTLEGLISVWAPPLGLAAVALLIYYYLF